MKKIFTLCLVALATMFTSNAYADEIIDGTESGTLVSVLVQNTDDLAKIPVTVYLNNPEIPVTAVELSIEAPVSVSKFLYDEDEEDFVNDPSARWASKHAAFYSAGTQLHGMNAFFISITSSTTQNFKNTEGDIVTVYFDGSELADGEYELQITDAIAVWSDKKSTNTYTTPNATAKFTIANGKATAVEGIQAEQTAAAKSITALDGTPVTSPIKGQIYVIDGKTVKY